MIMRILLLAVVVVAPTWSGIAPVDRATWWMEVAPVMIALPLLLVTATPFPLTPLLYGLIAVHAIILLLSRWHNRQLARLAD